MPEPTDRQDPNSGPGPASEPAQPEHAGETGPESDAPEPGAAPAPNSEPGAETSKDGGGVGSLAFSLPDFASLVPDATGQLGIDLLSDVNLRVKIELGRTRMLLEDVLRLGEGAVVELDRLAGDPVDVYVNDRLLARGEILVVNDNFCVRISEVIDPADLASEDAA